MENLPAHQKTIRVLTVDDHALLRKGIRALIGAESDMQLVAEASNGHEALEAFRAHRPDVTLMDLSMPDLNGIDALIAIRAEFPDARVIVHTTFESEEEVRWAVEAGACGYPLKGLRLSQLVQSIRDVHAGKKVIEPGARVRQTRLGR